MHPMQSVTLTHVHHTEARRVAGQHHGRDRRIRVTRRDRSAQPERTRQVRSTGLRALLRSAAELPQRLATSVRPAA